MDEAYTAFSSTSATATISELLTMEPGRRGAAVGATTRDRHVVSLHSDHYPDLETFKQAYLALKRPALCMIEESEIRGVLKFIRDSDDIAVRGEPPNLTKWRCDRIARSFSRQLDPLTQVYQRSHLMETLDDLCPRASLDRPVSLILLDIDNLKVVNDQHGPTEGNRVLKQLATLIQTLCQLTVVARTRGGEFGVLVERSESLAYQIAEVLLQAINDSQWCHIPGVTASIGVAGLVVPEVASTLLTQADEALYSAKANGRNRVVGYDQIAEISNRAGEDVDVISLENKARVMSERVTSFVTQQSKMIMENLRREADTDALTQLFNRRYLDRKLGELFQDAIKHDHAMCVALLDVDHFGEVNKRHGWPTGDHVLKSIADLIQNSIRSSDWVGRYGGEEICLVMPQTELRYGVMVCERIREAVAGHEFENHAGQPLKITVSAGVVEVDRERHGSIVAMFQEISERTLEAKRAGRNRVCSAEPPVTPAPIA